MKDPRPMSRPLRTQSPGAAALLLILLVGASASCGSEEAAASAEDAGSKDAGAEDAGPKDAAIDAPTGPLEPIHYLGRFHMSPSGASFAYSGSAIEAHFTGTGIDLDIKDLADWFDVSIDGVPQLLQMMGGATSVYHLATNLDPGIEHEVAIVKRTESFVGTATFKSLTPVGGALVPTPFPYTRKIEMIGDSITAGYGDLGENPCTFSPATENEDVAWGAVAAKHFLAMHTAIAWSGHGIARNGDGSTTNLIPEFWKRTIAVSSISTWDFSKYTPDVVVIFGSSNDFAQGDPGQPFVDAYNAFVSAVRAKYASAYIVCGAWTDFVAAPVQANYSIYVEGAVKKANDAGDAKVSYLPISVPDIDFGGCNGHPTVAGHLALAEKLVTHIHGLTGW